MKVCPKCNAQLDDNAAFCGICGFNFTAPPVQNYQPPVYAQFDPFDHTAEFDAKDVSENKIYAMAAYLLSFIGIIIALLASGSSEYAKFHVRQALKFSILETLVSLVMVFLVWTFIVPIAAGVFLTVIEVIKIAGGLNSNANSNFINLSSKVKKWNGYMDLFKK